MQGLQDPGGLVKLFFPCILLYLSCATVLRTKVNSIEFVRTRPLLVYIRSADVQ